MSQRELGMRDEEIEGWQETETEETITERAGERGREREWEGEGEIYVTGVYAGAGVYGSARIKLLVYDLVCVHAGNYIIAPECVCLNICLY